MTIIPVRPTDGMPASPGVRPAPDAAGAKPFTQWIDKLLDYANSRQTQADQSVQDLALGRTDNLHNVMLSVAEADLSFRLILEIRNRLTDALQEIMRMQV
jgi:flagellar hook-basal body complex protein FliE